MTLPDCAIPPYINGRFVDIERPQIMFSCQNPARPTDVLAFMGWSKELTDSLISGQKKAHKIFAQLSYSDRMKCVLRLITCIRENAEEIKSQMMLELARSKVTVDEEWRFCENLFEQLPKFCGAALSEVNSACNWSTQYAPVGLVLISSTVSLPVYTILASLLTALVAGNAVTMKPSSHCPLSGSIIASCVHQAQIEPGLVQVVYGGFEVFRKLALTHEFNVVFYTGGEETREQMRKDLFNYPDIKLVLCSPEKNAAIITESADIENSIEKILYGACADAGQQVQATGLVFVYNQVMQEFTEKFVKAVKLLPIGAKEDLSNPNQHVMGPLCSSDARERFLRFQGIAYRECVETLRWGKSIDNPGNGYFISPGVHIIHPKNIYKSVYASTQFLGSDLALVPITDLEEATSIIDTLGVGNIVSVHTKNEKDAILARKQSKMPYVYLNKTTTDLISDLPYLGNGHGGQAFFSGLSFLFSTVFSKTIALNTNKTAQTLFVFILAFSALMLGNADFASADYRSSVEGNEVVKGKLYPKTKRFQLLLNGGTLLNQPFLDTYLFQASVAYHFNEWHALSVDGFFGMSSDRGERTCIESFWYAEDRANTGSPCDPTNQYDPTSTYANEQRPKHVENDANLDTEAKKQEAWDKEKQIRGPYVRKPAYMPIRQINSMFSANYQWTPVYGKALWFKSFVGYLDFYGSAGLGIALSDYFPRKSTTICYNDNSNPNSGVNAVECPIAEDTKDGDITIAPYGGTSHPNGYGTAGRPTPISQTSPMMIAGLGSRFYIGTVGAKTSRGAEIIANVELKNFSLFGSDPNGDSAFMNFFALWGGIGVML